MSLQCQNINYSKIIYNSKKRYNIYTHNMHVYTFACIYPCTRHKYKYVLFNTIVAYRMKFSRSNFFRAFFPDIFSPSPPNVLSVRTEASGFFFWCRVLKTRLFSSPVPRLVRFDLSRTNNVRFSSSGFVFVFYNWPLSLIVIEIDLETLDYFHLFFNFKKTVKFSLINLRISSTFFSSLASNRNTSTMWLVINEKKIMRSQHKYSLVVFSLVQSKHNTTCKKKISTRQNSKLKAL